MQKNKTPLKEQEPKLTVPQIIDYCKNDLGITFDLMSQEKAADFLQKHNYFFRLKQYAEICQEKTKSGKYVGIDFGHLVELSTIDMFFRKLMLKMTIDLEHYLKVKIVNECQNNSADDGYQVVEAFLEKNPKIKEGLLGGAHLAGYSGLDFEKYLQAPAVWNFVEMINFFDFINFFSFYYDYFRLKSEYTKRFDSVRRLRNMAAHNACALCNFKPVQNFRYDSEIFFELAQSNIGIGNTVISSCLKVPLLNDFSVMLSLYTRLITSPQVKEKTFEEIKEFFDGRMVLRKEYFSQNASVKNAYQFARAVLHFYAQK